jgi:hypothetical protein
MFATSEFVFCDVLEVFFFELRFLVAIRAASMNGVLSQRPAALEVQTWPE